MIVGAGVGELIGVGVFIQNGVLILSFDKHLNVKNYIQVLSLTHCICTIIEVGALINKNTFKGSAY